MKIEAFILVGGRSDRFGKDKATTEFGETSMVERMLATVGRAFSNVPITLVAANEDQTVAKFASERKLKLVFDQHENRGPLGAVHAALRGAQTEWSLILACDLPFVSVALLERLAEFTSNKTDAVAPIQEDDRIQPLSAFYRCKTCVKVIENMFESDQSLPLKKVLESVRTRFVTFNELCDLPNASNFFLNVNTPEDFRTATGILTPK